jgi:uncharacterized protein
MPPTAYWSATRAIPTQRSRRSAIIRLVRPVTAAALRRLVIDAQGYASRSRTGTATDVEAAISRLSCVQLDSISVVERSHRIVLGGRVGAYPRETISLLLGAGRLFEYWAHEACLLPVEEWPLFQTPRTEGGRLWWAEVERTHPHLREEVLDAIRARGPLGSRHFEGEVEKGMWERKPAKAMLDRLWNRGELVIAGRQSFQRLYDLPERVLPRAVLDAPAPSEADRLRRLAVLAVRARGALTEAGIIEHWRLKGGVGRIRPTLEALVGDGLLERLQVDDGGHDVLVASGTELDRPVPSAAALLSPFDNLLWDRPFARRILGFDHLIEVYKPQPERRYGYYVLPFLWRDRIVGRVDLKSERRAGELVVRAVHLEDRARRSAALDDALDRALDRLRRLIGLDTVRR